MAKYQLIYIKLENFIKKVDNIIACRQSAHKTNVFKKLQCHFTQKYSNEDVQFFKIKIANAADVLAYAIDSQKTRFKQIGLQRIKSFFQAKQSTTQETIKITELKDRIRDKEKDLLEMNKKIENLRSIMHNQHSKINTTTKTAKMPHSLLTTKTNLISGAKKKKISQEDRELGMLGDQLRDIDMANEELKLRLSCTEELLFSFIEEISTQLSETLNDKNISEYIDDH